MKTDEMIDLNYMRSAFEMAISRCGFTSPNPPVGAVIVKDGEVISKGGTQRCGEDHAEVCALNAAGARAKGADIYVTLEPCSHFGKTPPCTDAIIRSGIRRVIIPVLDPNPKVSGKGVEILRNAGIEVSLLDSLKDDAIDILRPFFVSIREKRAYLIHKYAMTADGFTADKAGNSKWITNDLSRYLVHRLRGICDAIMIGSGTLLADNPLLNVRTDQFASEILTQDFSQSISGQTSPVIAMLRSPKLLCAVDPLRVVIGLPEGIDRSVNVCRNDNFIFYEKRSRSEKVNTSFANELRSSGKSVILEDDNFERAVLEDLYGRGIMTVLFEGGKTSAGLFYDNDLIDERYVFIAPKFFGNGFPVSAAPIGSPATSPRILNDCSVTVLGGDILYHGFQRGRNDVYRYY